MSEEEEDEPLDPRIQQELELLNKASLLINKLENDLDDARAKFRSLLTESTQQLEALSKKLGGCIERAKAYYDCRLRAKEVQIQSYQAAMKYERAMSMQTAAREMVELAEQGYLSKKPSFDTAWQEMLNHATMKVMKAENERMISEEEHQKTAMLYAAVQEEVNSQYKEHKRSISKSKAYYELKANFHTSLENQKFTIEKLQSDVNSAKSLYSKALGSLESISEEIHKTRQQRKACRSLGTREAGVGSESPLPPPCDQMNDSRARDTNLGYDQEPEIIISFPPAAGRGTQSTTYSADDVSLCPTMTPSYDMTTTTTVTNTTSTTTTSISSTDTTAKEGADICDTNHPIDSLGIKITVIPALPDDDVTVTTGDILPGEHSYNPLAKNTLNSVQSESACSSLTTSPVVMRHKRMLSGSIKLSAKRLLQESSSIDSDSGSVSSLAVLDDEGVKSAMSNEYFDGSFEAELRRSTHEDYSKLPDSLAHFQKPYESTRKSIGNFPSLDEVGLKLDQVLQLLEDGESVV